MLEDYKTAIPVVKAIIERNENGQKEILLQVRWKPGSHPTKSDPVYSGTLETPGGKLETHYATIFDELAREIKEETGLVLEGVLNKDKTTYNSNKDDEVIGFRPFYCTQQIKNGMPWIGYHFICTVKPGDITSQPGETKDARWYSVDELKDLVNNKPDSIFTYDLPALAEYVKSN